MDADSPFRAMKTGHFLDSGLTESIGGEATACPLFAPVLDSEALSSSAVLGSSLKFRKEDYKLAVET